MNMNVNNPSSTVLHFAETGRRNPTTPADRMPEPAYAIALDHLVFTCVDIVFCHQGSILLARRNRYPRKTWWIIGGRMVAGESPLEAVQRKAQEEAGLANLVGDRFWFLGVYSTSFACREQTPRNHGSHSVNLTYAIELTEPERTNLRLISSEYDPDYQWIKLDQVMSWVNPNDSLDQALLAIVHDLKRRSFVI